MQTRLSLEVAKQYKSPSQIARVVTESWASEQLYCIACASSRLEAHANNSKARDFGCPVCKNEYQLKAKKDRLGNTISDGAYDTMLEAVQSDTAPHLVLMGYAKEAEWRIKDLILIPRFSLTESAIVRRNPLGSSARRNGWVGCNINLKLIPQAVRIPLIQDGTVRTAEAAREDFKRLSQLESIKSTDRGWMLHTLRILKHYRVGKFSNSLAYKLLTPQLSKLYPNNNHLEPKIRQTLQYLRDAGFISHLARGEWEMPTPAL